MKGHLSEERLVDLLDGSEDRDAADHAACCATCAARLAGARAALDAAHGVEVPEPSPMYWEAFRRSVGRRIAEDRPRSAWRAWLAPAALTAAVAVVLIGLQTRVTAPPAAPAGAAPLGAWSPLPALDDDEALPVLEGLAARSDEAAWDAESGLGPFLAGLTDEESSALSEALRNQGREVKL